MRHRGAPPSWHWDESVEPLRQLLADGGVIAIPSESSYGLAADPRNLRGVETIHEMKGRPAAKALPVVAADPGQVEALGVDPEDPVLCYAATLWPAPLMVLVPLAAPLPASGGGTTLAVRVPAHRRLCELLFQLGFALTATSANRAGEPPVLDPAKLGALLAGHAATVVDDGILAGGEPSTLVAWSEERGGELQVLRRGAYAVDELPRHVPDRASGARTVVNRNA